MHALVTAIDYGYGWAGYAPYNFATMLSQKVWHAQDVFSHPALKHGSHMQKIKKGGLDRV